MENDQLTFEQVCEQYEFVDWELAKLVEKGEIVIEEDKEGEQWFKNDEILRYLRKDDYFISLIVASRICNRTKSNLRHQVRNQKLRGKKMGKPRGIWVTTLPDLENYMEEFSRG